MQKFNLSFVFTFYVQNVLHFKDELIHIDNIISNCWNMMRGEGDTAIWRWNVKWWFRWMIWNVCKHGPRWDSEWIVISSYLHCALSTIILHHPTTAARYARKLLLSYLKIFIVETKPANKAWRGRERGGGGGGGGVGGSVSAVLQSCVWMGLHWITAHTILLRSLTLGHNGLHLLSTQLLATAAIKR